MQTYVDGAKESVRCHLAAESLRATGALRLRAIGSSMLPAVWPGEILYIESRKIDHVRIGEIAAFKCYGKMVIHRVIEIRNSEARGLTLIARGDSLRRNDPPIGQAELLGVVVGLERRGRVLRPSEHRTVTERIAGAALGRWPRFASLLQLGL